MSASSSSKALGGYFTVKYGTGAAEGTLVQDVVRVGGTDPARVTFGMAGVVDDFFSRTMFDGIVGMGFPALSAERASPFFFSLLTQQAVTKGVFSFHMSNDADKPSALTLGGYDESHFTGTIFWLPLIRAAYFEVELSGVAMDDAMVAGSGSAILDTGTSLIVGPRRAVASIMAAMGPVKKDCSNVDSLPSVSFLLGGMSFPLRGSDLGTCAS
eukprot:Colp12_sorted_trinity150504_noHs@31050